MERAARRGDPDSSLNLTIRHSAPTPIARAFARMRSPRLSEHEQWSRTLGYVDVCLRFLTSVMYCEALGLGLKLGGDAEALISRRIHEPKYGDWSCAAFALGDLLLDEPVLFPRLSRAFGGAGSRTEVASAFRAIIEERNEGAHQEIPFPGDVKAQQILKEYQPMIRAINRALTAFKTHPLLVLTANEGQEEDFRIGGLRLVGEGVTDLPAFVTPDHVRLRKHVPFLMNADGDVLSLAPFVVLDQDPESLDLSPRLLSRWDNGTGRWLYSDSNQRAPGPLAATNWERWPPPAPREAFLTEAAAGYRKAGVLSDGVVDSLLGSAAGSDAFSIPGFSHAQRIGYGGTSVVWSARRVVPGHLPPTVAVKVLRETVAGNPDVRARLIREYALLSRISHPGIVTVEQYSEDPVPHIVMELVAGSNLQDTVERQHPNGMDVDQAASICLQVLDALADAHKLAIVHRDIKPRNIMIAPGGQPRLIDFGIAVHDRSGHTTRSEVHGTFDYAAPEQLKREQEVDARADIYSMGRVLQFLVTGDLNAATDLLPPGIIAIVARATRTDRDGRFATVGEMSAALQERMDGRWGGAPIQVGDRVARSYLLERLCANVDDVYAFDAVEDATDTRAVLLLAVRSSDLGRGAPLLSQAIKTLSASTRAAFGSPRALHEERGMLVVVASGDDAGVVLDGILNDRVARPAAPAPGMADHFAPYLAEVWRIKESWTARPRAAPMDVVNAAEVVRRAILVLCAQVAALTGRSLTVEQWRTWTNGTFGGAIRGLESVLPTGEGALMLTEPRAMWERIGALKWLARARNEVAHGLGGADGAEIDVGRFLDGLEAVYFLGCILWAQLAGAPERVRPFVVSREDGGWFVLDLSAGKGSYLSLDLRTRAQDLDDPARAWLAEDERRMLAQDAQARDALRRKRHILESATARLLGMSGVVVVKKEVHLGPDEQLSAGRTRAEHWVDLVAYGPHDRVLAVIEGYSGLPTGAGPGVLGVEVEASVRGALGFFLRLSRAAFAGLTDGERFIWYQEGEDGVLVELPPKGWPPWGVEPEEPIPGDVPAYFHHVVRLTREWEAYRDRGGPVVPLMSEVVRLAFMVMYAQISAALGARPSVDEWRTISAGSLAETVGGLDRLLVSCAALVAGRNTDFPSRILAWVTESRALLDRAGGAAGVERFNVDDLIPALHELVEMVKGVALKVPDPASLRPLVVLREAGWFVLSPRRGGRYVSLQLYNASEKLDDEARAWLAGDGQGGALEPGST